MKKLFVFIIALAISLGVTAQDYQKLWKEYDENIDKLLPESAGKTLDKIEKQAIKDNNEIQLLKMIIKRCEVLNMKEEFPVDTIKNYCKQYMPKLSQPSQIFLTRDTIIDYSDADYLKTIPMKDYAVLFEGHGEVFDIDLEPTLYDYALHRNISQYSGIYKNDKVDECYQKLIQFDLDNNYKKAYYNNKFNHLGHIINEKDFEKFNEFEKECDDNETIVRIKLEKMSYFLYKKDYLTADKICDEIMQKVDKKHTVYKECVRLKENIFKKTIEIQMQEVQIPDMPIAVGLTYRNTTNPSYRIYKLSSKEFAEILLDEKEKTFKTLTNNKLSKSGTIEIPKEEDMQTHSSLIALPALKPGCYLLVFSNCDKFNNISDLEMIPFQVSNMTYITMKTDDGMNIYTINRETSQPIGNVNAIFYKKQYSYKSKSYEQVKLGEATSDKNGYLKCPLADNSSFLIDLHHNGDTLTAHTNHYLMRNSNDNSRIETHIFTDRDIYRPGQTVYFKGVVCQIKNNEQNLMTDYETTVKLSDQNYSEVDKKTLKTDDFGAFSGSFYIPKDRVNGYYNINGLVWFRVEEYKRPTFEVLFDDMEDVYKIGDSVTVKGSVMALSGFGLGNVKYKYTINRKAEYPYFRYWGFDPWSYPESKLIASGETTTSNDGRFTIGFRIMPNDNEMKHCPYYIYEIKVEATSAQGETQSETYIVNARYNKYDIEILSNKDEVDTRYNSPIDVKNLKNLEIKVSNANGKPAKTKIECKIFKYKDVEKYSKNLGNFDRQLLDDATLQEYFPYFDFYTKDDPKTKDLVYQYVTDIDGQSKMLPDDVKLNPGKYEFKLKSLDDTLSVYGDAHLIIDLASKGMPYKTMCWTMLDKNTASPGDVVKYYVGSSEKNTSALIVLKQGDKVLKSERVALNNSVYCFSYKVKEENRGTLSFQVAFVKHNIVTKESSDVAVPYDNLKLGITLHTERSKMLPGERETWSVTVKDYKNNPIVTSLMAGMYDASLDNILDTDYNNQWFMNTTPQQRYSNTFTFDNSYDKQYRNQYPQLYPITYYPNVMLFSNVDLLPYGYHHLFGRKYLLTDGVRTYANSKEAVLESVEEAAEINNDEAAGNNEIQQAPQESENEKGSQQMKIRKDFNETAFFYPNLITDDNGDATFTFTMPDALTRWKLRLLAYSKDLKVGNLEKTFVTQQPLMIMADMPRFAYDEDTIWLVANVINLTDEELVPSAKLEVFDDDDNSVNLILSEPIIKMQTIPAGQSNSVRWKVAMKKDLNILKFRFSAITDGFSDAEQHLMPVLSTEIFMTQTYELTAKAHSVKDYNFDINNKDERNHEVILHFNENPTWSAIHTLPYIAEGDDKYALTAFYRYFVNKTAKQIIDNHPEIAEKFENSYKNDTLSELQKYEDLKSILLQETPWVWYAKHEAKQRADMAKLFDNEAVNQNIKSAFNILSQKQTPNGGWAWIEGCPESTCVTQYILIGLGRLGTTGETAEKAYHFIENEVVKEYEKLDTKKKKENYHCNITTLRNLYAMSYYNYKTGNKFDKAKEFFCNKLTNDWKHFGFEERAYVAMIFDRDGDRKTALAIIKSLREFGIKNESGMYWRNCDVVASARIMEAFDEIDQRVDEIDAMKLWILLQKRTNMWENERASVEAVSAIVNHGSNWTEDGNVVLKIDGNAVDTDETRFTANDLQTRSSLPVSIENNSGHVAWGGLFRQYFVPIDKVEKHNDAIKIDRKLYVETIVDNQKKYIPISEKDIKVGDKVKIVISFENSQELEFVYLKDLRGACFEPTEQLSRYHYDNGLWYYQSTSDVAMEFFFERLAKGKHELSHTVYVTKEGSYSAGYSLIQCQYAPEFGAYSNGSRISVNP